MLREEVWEKWKNCKEKVFQLKKKSIDNYVIMHKRTILGLDNYYSYTPLETYNLWVESGEVTKKIKRGKRKNVVELHTELLKVAILEELDEDIEKTFVKNYEGEIDEEPDNHDKEPFIEEVD